ncbi:hypothetical protein KJ969_03030, partial [Patescibacteria group bacterium]|nr:hypothetical protein [Patescibacteria group bacterium]
LNHELNDKATDIISPSFAEPVSIVLKDYIEDELKNYVHGQADVLRQANDLLETYHNSLLEEEELSRLKILQKIINKKIKLTNIEGDEEILNDIRRHQKNFYWIKNNYKKATELDIDYFIKSIKELSLEDLKKLDFDKTSDIKNKKQKILDPIKSERLNTLSRIADEFAHLHDNRKKWMLIYQAYLWKLLSEFAKRKNLNKEQIGWYTPEELEENIKLDIEQIKNRKKLTVLLYERGKKSLLTGLAARDWKNKLIIENKNIAELKGMVAYPGKVKGTVKVLSSVREIDKLKQGEILVTSNTTPDYVPAMKKAIAFLTEKGGITSHAAIVSREMRKPCIVGINDISDILKDNDEVEVDADNGVVKILRKTEIR